MYTLVVRPTLSGKPHTVVGMHERSQENKVLYGVDHLERMDGGLVFSLVIQRVKDLLFRAKGMYREARLILDMEESDRSIWFAFRGEGIPAIAVYVDKQVDGFGTSVHRTELLSVVYLRMGEGRLKWARNLELSKEFREQLRMFRLRPEREYLDGRVVLEEAGSEDLIRSVAIGLWYAERNQKSPSEPKVRSRPYDPLRA